MKIVFLSLSGNCRKFASRLDIKSEDLIEVSADAPVPKLNNEKYLVIAPTYEASITEVLFEFLEENERSDSLGIIGSGNRNFGSDYIVTAKELSKQFNIPIVAHFEYAGLDSDVELVNDIIYRETKAN